MDKKNLAYKIFLVILIIIAIIIYRKFDFNFYSKGVSQTGKTTFSRDSKETSDKKRSYKIESKDFNDAMFYRKINVKQNTPYKVSCMVKTQNVEQYENAATAGAQITLKGTEEHSKILSGTNDWTLLEFCFNSKNNASVEIGFRMGGNTERAKGTAWFSNLQIEEGALDTDNTWKFVCFIFENTDITLENGQEIKESILQSEEDNIEDSLERFKNTCPNLCKNKMEVEYEIIHITDPITTVTNDEENGYYISEKDIYNLIERYTENKEYDHIFACIKMPEEKQMLNNKIVEWVGLGNMEYCGKGLSNIKINDDRQYSYSTRNTFPEEVFIHEFLHTLERNAEEYGFERPALHSYADYGYQDSDTDGLRTWYADYMNRDIESGDNYVGLPEEIYGYKPVQLSNFEYTKKLDLLDEPKNIIQTIQSILKRIGMLFQKKDVTLTTKQVSK